MAGVAAPCSLRCSTPFGVPARFQETTGEPLLAAATTPHSTLPACAPRSCHVPSAALPCGLGRTGAAPCAARLCRLAAGLCGHATLCGLFHLLRFHVLLPAVRRCPMSLPLLSFRFSLRSRFPFLLSRLSRLPPPWPFYAVDFPAYGRWAPPSDLGSS